MFHQKENAACTVLQTQLTQAQFCCSLLCGFSGPQKCKNVHWFSISVKVSYRSDIEEESGVQVEDFFV